MTKPRKQRVHIRPPTLADRGTFLAAVARSRSLHRPWASPPADKPAYRAYLNRISSNSHRGFLVVHRGTGSLVGVINLNHIIGGRLRNAFLGYYAFADHAGQGLMREGLELVLAQAFRTLKLHRVEANIQPGNHDSVSLVKRCGFVREGFSRRYLKVGGRWRDHERWALLMEDWACRKGKRAVAAHPDRPEAQA